MRFFRDRKLDNRREPVDAELVRHYYCNEDENITEETIHFHERTGYFLRRDDGELSIDIDRIGKVRTMKSANTGAKYPEWEMFGYPDEIEQDRERFKEPIQRFYERKLSGLEKLKNALNL